jgi:hypothetical protein
MLKGSQTETVSHSLMATASSLILLTNSERQDKSELMEVELLNNHPFINATQLPVLAQLLWRMCN